MSFNQDHRISSTKNNRSFEPTLLEHDFLNITKSNSTNLERSFLVDLGDRFSINKFGRYENARKKLFLSKSSPSPYLTAKEIEIYYYCIFGYSAPDIANLLHRSKRTIESHLENIKDKLNCKKQAELIAIAVSTGLVYSIFYAMTQIKGAKDSEALLAKLNFV